MLKNILSSEIPAYVRYVTYFTNDGQIVEVPLELRAVKLMKTPEEKAKYRRIYRKEYMSRPKNQEKLKNRLNDPDVIQKRKEYAAKPEVRQRKKDLAARHRLVRKLLKEEKPEIYKELLGMVTTSDESEEINVFDS